MSKNLFQTPEARDIGGQSFLVSKVPFEAFDPAVVFGSWLLNTAGGSVELHSLRTLKDQPEVKQALQQLLASCLAVNVDEAVKQLTVQDIGQMPLPMVFEATYVVMEVNLDFFVQTLEAVQPLQQKLMSIGSPLLSSSLPQGTTASKSVATATTS